MLNILARASVSRFVDPVGGWLVRAGIGPDAITVVGTIGTVASALWFFSRGQLVVGTVAVTVFVLLDVLDGAVARARGSGTPFALDAALWLLAGLQMVTVTQRMLRARRGAWDREAM